jgi:hypothetical protein
MKKFIAYMIVLLVWVWVIISCLPFAHALSAEEVVKSMTRGADIAKYACEEGNTAHMRGLIFTDLKKCRVDRDARLPMFDPDAWDRWQSTKHRLDGFDYGIKFTPCNQER